MGWTSWESAVSAAAVPAQAGEPAAPRFRADATRSCAEEPRGHSDRFRRKAPARLDDPGCAFSTPGRSRRWRSRPQGGGWKPTIAPVTCCAGDRAIAKRGQAITPPAIVAAVAGSPKQSPAVRRRQDESDPSLPQPGGTATLPPCCSAAPATSSATSPLAFVRSGRMEQDE